MLWTSTSDVTLRWAGGDVPSVDLIAVWLDDAERVLLSEYPDIPDRITDDDLDVVVVRQVVARMVIRALRNPDRVRSEQLGPQAFTYADDDSAGLLTLTDEDRRLIDSSGIARQVAFTIDPTPSTAATPSLAGAWVNGPDGMAPGEWW